MFILKIYKHGFFSYKSKNLRTPCTIKFQRLSLGEIDTMEARLRGSGFKNKDYDLLVDQDFIKADFGNHPILKEELSKLDSSKNKEILNQIRELKDKVDNLPSFIEIENMENFLRLILNKLNSISSNNTTTLKDKKFEEDNDVTFIPSINTEGMEIKSNISSSKMSKSLDETESAAEMLSSITKKKEGDF